MDRLIKSSLTLSLFTLPLAYAGSYTPQIYYPHIHATQFHQPYLQHTVTAYQHAAEEYLRQSASLIDVSYSPDQFKLIRIQHSLLGYHFTYQQILNNLPIDDQLIIISVLNDFQLSKVYKHLSLASSTTHHAMQQLSAIPTLTEDQALEIAWHHLAMDGELMGLPQVKLLYSLINDSPRLVYDVQIDATSPHGFWQYRVDAQNGEILSTINRIIPRKQSGILFTVPNTPRHAVPYAQALNHYHHKFPKPLMTAEESSWVQGSAYVFQTNPKVDLNDDSLDNDDEAASFENAYVARTLPEISFKNDRYRLEGPYVKIIDFDSPKNPPVTTQDGVWHFKRGENGFNDANVFYHIDTNQRYLQSLGFTQDKGIQDGPIGVDTDGDYGSDNSYYSPSSNRLAFGHGGVPDTEDSDVILHEYGHALEHSINANWMGGDTGAMGEGFGDYWATSYRHTFENGTLLHPSWVFVWDGHNQYWKGRVLDATELKYDPKKTYYAHNSLGNNHTTDELWSTPLYQAAEALVAQGVARSEVDQIIIEAHFGLGSSIKMRQMAESIVDAAEKLYPNGPHAEVFREKFKAQNILNAK